MLFNQQNATQSLQYVSKFVESTYLHQVVELKSNGCFNHFSDLNHAIFAFDNQTVEWRVHFHVPIYAESISNIKSTQADILDVLKINKISNISNLLEIETYTWDILPSYQKLPLIESVLKELEWLKNALEE